MSPMRSPIFAVLGLVLALMPMPSRSAARATLDPAAVLESSVAPATPWPTAVFAPPADALPPSRDVEGELTIVGEPADHFDLLLDQFGLVKTVPQMGSLPGVRVTLVSRGGEVIPVQRGPILKGHPAWDWIFEPGRAWDSPSRPSVTFVSLPFSLMQRNSNCMHNGLALFALGAHGAAKQVAYQIGSETCFYQQFDMWGLAGASFAAHPVTAKADTLAAHDREVAARLPVRPITDLGEVAAGFGSQEEVKPAALTTFGFVHGGVLYAGPCPTRYGPYPYCDVLDLPSYSWAKSIAGGIGLMRLEALYPGAKAALVKDYVPECAGMDWGGVTFENLLDMTTGHYDSAKAEVDEDGAAMVDFIVAETHAEHAGKACRLYPRKEAPGNRAVYHTSDTYLLGTAMNAFLRAHGRHDADYYRDLLVPIFRRLGVSPVLYDTRRSIDEQRQPFTGWGLVLHRNDAALLARLFQDGGKLGDEQLLAAKMVAEAMQRDPARPGLPIYDSANWRYQHSFWVRNVAGLLDCPNATWVPFFSGLGGLSNVMLPNGDVYFRIGDGFDYDWAISAKAANRVNPICAATAR